MGRGHGRSATPLVTRPANAGQKHGDRLSVNEIRYQYRKVIGDDLNAADRDNDRVGCETRASEISKIEISCSGIPSRRPWRISSI
jgi:hypothetical protein